MKRGKKGHIKKADAILTADWHLREDQPICRTDNFQETQVKKLQFIKALQKEHGCPVLHAGDLFHHWKPSPWLITFTIRNLPDQFMTVFGNHDLPQHNLELSEKSGVTTLQEAGSLTILSATHWNESPASIMHSSGKSFMVWHTMTYKGGKPYLESEDPPARSIIRKYKADLIITGHNHKPFTERYEERLLVNPGSITRQEADEVHEPRVYLWWAESNHVEAVYLPFQKDVITREHLQEREKRDSRIDAFIERLNDEWEVGLSFEENVQRFFKENKTKEPIMKIIYKAIDKELMED